MPIFGGIMSASRTVGTNDADDRIARELATKIAERVETALAGAGLRSYVSPLLQTPNLFVVLDPEKVTLIYAKSHGLQEVITSRQSEAIPALELGKVVAQEKGWAIQGAMFAGLDVNRTGEPTISDSNLDLVASSHLNDIQQEQVLAEANLTGFEHLAPQVERFLRDHPTFTKNVFLMMHFGVEDYREEIRETIVNTLAERGYEVIRADDKDYHDELWSNIVIQMIGCKYGVGVFEKIDEEEFNPNVALEVGFMKARQQEVLLLKEKRVAALNADIVGKLYKPFDMMNIAETIGRQVSKWADVDLQ